MYVYVSASAYEYFVFNPYSRNSNNSPNDFTTRR